MEVVSKNDFHVYPLAYQIANPKKALNLDYCWSKKKGRQHYVILPVFPRQQHALVLEFFPKTADRLHTAFPDFGLESSPKTTKPNKRINKPRNRCNDQLCIFPVKILNSLHKVAMGDVYFTCTWVCWSTEFDRTDWWKFPAWHGVNLTWAIPVTEIGTPCLV